MKGAYHLSGRNIMLQGDKISLQPVCDDDISDEYVSWLNDLGVVRYSNQRFLKHSKESCLGYVQSFLGTDNLFLSVKENQSRRIIGSITAYLNRHHGTADIGLMIGDRSVWGKGYGFEAWQLMMQYLFDTAMIRKITGGTLRDNTGMIKIMERAGMELEAIRKEQEMLDGKAVDILYFAKFSDV